MMTFDDRITDGQPDAHSAVLRRKERLEKTLDALRIDPDAGVLNGQQNAIAFTASRFDGYLPRPISDIAHSVGGVEQQVHDDLLKLDAIARNEWDTVVKLIAHDDTMSLQLRQREGDNFSRSLVEIDRFDRTALLDKERP
jgi:hypothetical protein